MSLNNNLYGKIEKGEREGGRAGQLAGIFKVRLGLGELEGRDRDTEIQRNRETKKQKDIETELTIKIPSKPN
jgi:hypothetical protein